MTKLSAFLIVWCVMVAIGGLVSFAWAINDLRKGSARFSFFAERVQRSEEPFEFWLAVGSKLLAVPLAAFMLWFALSGWGI